MQITRETLSSNAFVCQGISKDFVPDLSKPATQVENAALKDTFLHRSICVLSYM